MARLEIQTFECKLMLNHVQVEPCLKMLRGRINSPVMPASTCFLSPYLWLERFPLNISHLIFWSINRDRHFFQIQPMDYKDCYVIKCLCIPGQTRTMHTLCFYQCNNSVWHLSSLQGFHQCQKEFLKCLWWRLMQRSNRNLK